MGIIKTDAEFHDADNQLKLDDLHYGLVGPDAGKAILGNGIDKLGEDWRPIPGVHTTPATELGALPQNFANLQKQIAEVKALLMQVLVTKPGLTLTPVDIQAIAKATNDDLAARVRS